MLRKLQEALINSILKNFDKEKKRTSFQAQFNLIKMVQKVEQIHPAEFLKPKTETAVGALLSGNERELVLEGIEKTIGGNAKKQLPEPDKGLSIKRPIYPFHSRLRV